MRAMCGVFPARTRHTQIAHDQEGCAVALTPQDVREKLFTSVRFKHGYDEDEVDAFLDEVERELTRLYAELGGTPGGAPGTAEPAASPGGTGDVVSPADTSSVRPAEFGPPGDTPRASAVDPITDTGALDPVGERPDLASGMNQSAPAPLSVGTAESAPATAPAPPTPVVAADVSADPSQSGDMSSPTEEMIRRTLLIAQRTGDAVIAEARADAAAITAEATQRAAATEHSAVVEHTTRQRERQAEHERLSGSIEQLRSFEKDFRGRLRAYLHLQLRDLEGNGPSEPASLAAGGRNALASGLGVGVAPASSATDVATSVAETGEPGRRGWTPPPPPEWSANNRDAEASPSS